MDSNKILIVDDSPKLPQIGNGAVVSKDGKRLTLQGVIALAESMGIDVEKLLPKAKPAKGVMTVYDLERIKKAEDKRARKAMKLVGYK